MSRSIRLLDGMIYDLGQMSQISAPRPLVFPDDWSQVAEAIPATPTEELTDFSLFADLSSLSASWWGDVRSNGWDIRATDDNDNPLPLDVVDFNKSLMTGFAVIKQTVTVTPGAIRLYAGSPTANKFAKTSPFGQYAAYDSNFKAFWPDGGGIDRTANGFDLMQVGGATVGGVAGVAGAKGTLYNGTTQRGVHLGEVIDTYPFTLIAWGKILNTINGCCIALVNDAGYSTRDMAEVRFRGAVAFDPITLLAFPSAGTGGVSVNTLTTYANNVFQHAAGRGVSTTDRSVFLQGGGRGDSVTSVPLSGMDLVSVGARAKSSAMDQGFAGTVSLAQVHGVDRSNAWIAYQSSMANQGTFWGAWA